MLVPESANMVQQAILQSGMPNAACGEWCQDNRPAVQQVCDLDYITCNSAAMTTDQIVDQLRVAPEAMMLYHELNGRAGVSVNTLDGVFFKQDPWQAVRDRSFDPNKRLLIGFTSYEG